MLQTTIDDLAPAGPLAKTVRRIFMSTAKVTEVQTLSSHFRLITLAGDALKGVSWVPGQKIQVAMHGLSTRTYTPICWDAENGSTSLLGYSHGVAPGANWLVAAKVGETCQFLGPRSSIQLDQIQRPTLLFGDETSFALAYSTRHALGIADTKNPLGTSGFKFVLEVNSRSESQDVIDALGIEETILFERQISDAHLSDVDVLLSNYCRAISESHYVLTGKSTSVQRLLRILRSQNVRSNKLTTKAYWAPGKVGLD